MFRIDGPGATQDNKFTEGDPANGTRATVVSAEWLNALQEEVARAIEGDGQVLDKLEFGQLAKVLATRVIYVESVAELASIPNPLEGQQALVDGLPYKYTGGAWVEVLSSGRRLDDGLYRAEDSGELFQLPTGVNEFDIVFENGLYHLFYDDKTQIKHRQAATIQGLSGVADDLTIAGRYPSAFFESGVWHLFLWDQGNARTDHYTASEASGPYTYQDTVASGKADFAVAKNPSTGQYVGTYKDTSGGVNDKFAGVLTSSTLSGPWVDQGMIFTADNRAAWHNQEEADPAIVFFNGRTFLLFAGATSVGFTAQRVGIIELDESFFPVSTARVLVDPKEIWQDGPQGRKVFSHRLLTVNGVTRLFYSHNPGTAVAAGWAYLDYDEKNTPVDSRLIYSSKPLSYTPVTRMLNFKSGVINSTSDFASFTTSLNVIRALSPLGEFDEFTVVVFLSNVPAVTGAQTIFSASEDPDTGSFVKIGIDASGFITASLRNGIDADVSFTTTFEVDDSNYHSIVLRRDSAGAVTLFTDTGVQSEATMASPIGNIDLVKVGNNFGISEPVSEQFIGDCKVEVYDRALPISAVSG